MALLSSTRRMATSNTTCANTQPKRLLPSSITLEQRVDVSILPTPLSRQCMFYAVLNYGNVFSAGHCLPHIVLGNFHTSPSTCPTSPLVTANVPPVTAL